MPLTQANVIADTNASALGGLSENVKVAVRDVTFDSSYPTGGLALTPTDFGFKELFAVIAEPKSTGGYQFVYDFATQKLLAYWGDNAGGASGPLIQVTNGTNIATVVARVVAIGR